MQPDKKTLFSKEFFSLDRYSGNIKIESTNSDGFFESNGLCEVENKKF